MRHQGLDVPFCVELQRERDRVTSPGGFDVQKPIIERAYELAKSGRCKDVREIERHLKSEGYRGFYADMAGPALRKALRNICLGNLPSRPVQAM